MVPGPPPANRSPSPEILPLDEVARLLTEAVERSPADETELVWTESRRGRAAHDGTAAGNGGTEDGPPVGRRTTVQVRVRERDRVGFHRTGGPTGAGSAERRFGQLDGAVRLALGQARLSPPAPALPLAGPGGRRDLPPIHDPAVATLTPAVAGDLLAAGAGPHDRLVLEWHELRLVVANSRGMTRSTEATSLTLTARRGEGPGAGWAAGSARSLSDLAAPHVVERAAERAAGVAPGKGGDAVPEDRPVLLAPEATAVLVGCLADGALSSRAFLDRTSWLAGRLGERAFGRAVTLVDDGMDPSGLPFPFDADGWPKRRTVLVEAGVLQTPAIDAALGRELGRTPTPHAVAFDESRAGNLFLEPGDANPEDLRRAAEGGLWICALDGLRCTDPASGAFRAVARGVRHIEGGELGPPLADLEWHGNLADLLAAPAAVGGAPRNLASHGAWGGIRAPALALPATTGLHPLG